ncbi:porin [Polaromonas sp. CG_9.11]|uniref:porin n=1 Tax=Polaromonas sp. CG_9.11 TaxID=2787730 RepID=UPI0018CA5E84|nr:porin [Polaromonas sp. CG_9.11]MBG6076028.1 putative porin [Polaromonas sp. CG_9.11]
MKKSLIALAVLAASGAAMAQSSVTLYGIADAFVGSTETQVGGVGQRQTNVSTSGVNGSRWGLKGSEDLGGGMKAIFTLESGFNLDTGAQKTAGSIFDRQAYVGLQSGFGTVSLGRQYSAYDNLQGATNHNYDAFTFSARGAVSANGIKDYTNRVSNSIAYASPSFSGFSGAVVYGFGEDKKTNVGTAAAPLLNSDATDSASVHIKYANGPILVGYAYQEDKLSQTALGQDKNKYNLVGGSYDFGMAKLTGSYNTVKNNVLKDKEGQIGVSVPFGAAAVSVGYARSKSEGAGVERTGKGYSILGTYALSKRTGLYAGAQNTKAYIPTATAGLNTVRETETTTYGLGVRHSF